MLAKTLSAKILGRPALVKRLALLKRAGKRIVFTNGCFDILHYGHLKLLSDAKAFGDVLVVGLNSDASIRMIKGRSRPVRGQGERAAMLAGLAAVDYVALFRGATPRLLIEAISPHVLVKGGDWHAGRIVGARFVESRGGKVVVIPLAKGYSTTSLIEKIRKRRG